MSQALKRVQSVSVVLMAVMLWQYGGVSTYATTRNLQSRQQYSAGRVYSLPKELAKNRFDPLLAELKEVVKHGSAKTKSAPEKGFADIGKLTELKQSLVEENEKIQEQFDQLKSSLKQKGLPGEILNRHAQSVREYEAKYAVLMARLESIESAQDQSNGWWAKLTGKNKEVNWDGVLGETLKFLEENTPRPVASRVDPRNLPHRSLKTGKPIPPKLTREDWLKAFPKDSVILAPASPRPAAKAGTPTALFATTPPTPADSAETIEVRFTQDIQNLANSLDKNPVKIFNWVRNNIEFVPTWGSIQGGQLCLENRAGNAFDTASLLIALLRASGHPARYQMGTIEVPVDKFMNWAGGFTNIDAAASLFASAGVPSVVRRVNQSGQVVTVKLEHVWVKAFVDHAPSGGAVNAQGDAWIDLDPSFKQYDFPAPVDLSQFVRLTNAQTFLNQTLAPATVNQTTGEIANMDLPLIQSTLQPDETAVFNYLSSNFPQKSVREIIGDKSIAVRELPILAARLPYKVIVPGVGFADLPAGLRHTLELSVSDVAGNQLLSFARSLPALSGSRVTLGYLPAAEADRQAIAALIPSDPQQPLPDTIPTSFINMKPELKIDNQVVSTGSAARLGTDQNLQMKFTSPTIQTPVIQNSITVGENFAIALDLQQVSSKTLTNIADRLQQIANEVSANPANPQISPRELAELLLSAMASGWFKQVDLLNRITAQMFGVVTTRYPSAGMAFADLIPVTTFGTVYQVKLGGVTMDIDRDIVVTLSKSNDARAVVHDGVVMGMLGSGLEASIPGQLFRRAGDTNEFWLSTSGALATAQSLGDTTVALTSANLPLVASRLGFSNDDLQDVQDGLNSGTIVMTHERLLRDGSGTGFLGYVQLDPVTGSGAYMIGGANGGQMAECKDSSGSSTNTADSLVNSLGIGAAFDVSQSVVGHLIDPSGGPRSFVSKVVAILDLVRNLGNNLNIYLDTAERLGDSARPLMGLIILMAGLSLLKELIPLDPMTGIAAGMYLNMVSWVAFRMAAILINRIVELELVSLCIDFPDDISKCRQFEPGCLIRDVTQ